MFCCSSAQMAYEQGWLVPEGGTRPCWIWKWHKYFSTGVYRQCPFCRGRLPPPARYLKTTKRKSYEASYGSDHNA